MVPHGKEGRWAGSLLVALAGVGALAGAVFVQHQSALRGESWQALRTRVPAASIEGYQTSDRCLGCHPDQYASWRRTYHSSMTQLPSDDTVVGDFDDHRARVGDGQYRFFRRGEEFWIELPRRRASQLGGLLGVAEPGREHRVVMLTGSHHQQVYWIGLDDRLVNAGVNWVRDFERYVPHAQVFLKPPTRRDPVGLQLWTGNCVRCHSTPAWRSFPVGRKAQLHPMRPASLTERSPERSDEVPAVFPPVMPELGISCEACHGPADAHVEAFASPLARYAHHLGLADDARVIHPGKLSAAESTELCGSCHAARRPFAVGASRAERIASERVPELAWPDGMVRSGGRSYLAVTRSPCYRGGDFSCLSCHSMHDAPPDDQLADSMEGDAACTGCHPQLASGLEAHTRHEPGSEGSRCYNCHMPNTAFNLLKATRSHQVDSPDVPTSVATGRPNACNLCHLDRSLGWTAEHLSEWYGHRRPELSDEEREVSAAVLGALRGDAGLRALYAWSMGWAPAQQASGRDWMAPLLALLLADPYPAVRAVATRSLETLPGFADFQADPWSAAARRGELKTRALEHWRQAARVQYRPDNQVLVAPGGGPDWARVHALLTQRDDRDVHISE